ncbi:hypothetical protein ILUMI_19413, partial [Ignelater luminosus]
QRMYWSNDVDLGCPVVKVTMSQNRYLKMKSLLHFQDNSWTDENKNDKGFKIRLLITEIRAQFQKFGVFG